MNRTAWLVVGMAAVVGGTKLLIENVLGVPVEEMVRGLLHPGNGTAAVVIGLLVADIVLPVPSSLVMVLSGAAFGTLPGAALALVGSIAGEWLGFELVRRYGRSASRRVVSDRELEEMSRLFRQFGVVAVMVTRALPVLMETMSLAAGLSDMPRSKFLWASFLGTAPIVLIYAYAGAVSRSTGTIVPALVILAAVAGFGWILHRHRRAS